MKRRTVEVGHLPEYAFGARDPMWWAMVLLIAIEGTMLVLLAISYYYVQGRISPWPPSPMPRDLAWLATAELAILALSVVPMEIARHGAVEGSVRKMRWGLVVTVVLGLALGALRWAMFDQLPFRWDANAYASVVWTLLGLHTLHGLTGLYENALFVWLMFHGPIEQKHRVDIDVNCFLWYFVVGGQVLIWSVVFLEVLV